jgi:large subunit ribosomal protein L13e
MLFVWRSAHADAPLWIIDVVAMVKHNNVVPNQHFRKDWQRLVKTWFDQPAKKSARRVARHAKAARVAPRPVNLLRPAVRGQTLKYNRKVRMGKGFTLDELKAAGVTKKGALGIGIAVDYRRKNRCQEGFQINVQRLNEYRAKLVIFPRKSGAKHVRRGDSSPEDLVKAKQVVSKATMALPGKPAVEAPRPISAEERKTNAHALMRKESLHAKLWGKRAKRSKEKTEAEAAKKGK